MPSWARDGNNIVHTRYSTEFISQEVFIMNPNGRNPNRLTYNSKDDRFPKIVYDKNIVYWSDSYLWLIDSTGSNKRQITTEGVDVDFGHPFSLSPDGNKIVYTKYEPNNWTYENGTLWIIDLITAEKRQLTFNPKPEN